ncbi:hypothetical protein GF420_01790 [candidate division GN15 bacterium]|nr:hypothetical protein [candidate division GN15 bacterium]
MVAAGAGTGARQRCDQGEDKPLTSTPEWKGRSVVAAALLLLFACAEVAQPPGGPIDQTGPTLLQATPADGATNVAPDNKIRLLFSERIVRPRTGQPVFIAPRPDRQADIDWGADDIVITLPDSFQTNQTYLVSIASTIADLRGNKLDTSITIAFTTGERLDSGSIAGHVIENGQAVGAAHVGLFDMSYFSDTTLIDSVLPEYQTITNDDGYFSFSYLPPEEFRLVAWRDQNRNEVLNPIRESFGVPDRQIDLSGDLPLYDLTLPLTSRDTTSAAIISATYTQDKLFRVRFSRPLPIDLLSREPGNALLRAIDETVATVAALGLLERDEDSVSSATLYFGELEPGLYDLEITYDASRPAVTLDSVAVERREDQAPPTITSFHPEDARVFLREARMRLLFSEPLDRDSITPATFALLENDTLPIPVANSWGDPFQLDFTARLTPGNSYRLDVTEFDLIDRAGNLLGDSLTTYSFSIYDTDSLGSIAGQVSVQLSDRTGETVMVVFDRVGQQETFTLPVRGNRFRIDLPSGKYLLSAFIDSDLNGEPSNGSLFPYTFSEPRTAVEDTVAVRARFETSGIEITFR